MVTGIIAIQPTVAWCGHWQKKWTGSCSVSVKYAGRLVGNWTPLEDSPGYWIYYIGKMKVFNAFIWTNLYYCPLVWMNKNRTDLARLEKVQKRALRLGSLISHKYDNFSTNTEGQMVNFDSYLTDIGTDMHSYTRSWRFSELPMTITIVCCDIIDSP